MLLKYGLLVLAYLLGSIPFSVILGRKFRGIDVREHGSGNPGGTNSLRFLGKSIGYSVLILDGLKAGLIVLLIQLEVFDGSTLFNPLAYGVAAAFGHVYSVYIKFKGGKAVAATVGIMIAYNPLFAFIMMFAFLISLRIFKYVSASSTIAVATGFILGIFAWISGSMISFVGMVSLEPNTYSVALYLGLLLLLVAFRHKKNFQNIKNGVEPKVKLFDKKKVNSN
ncbi:Glycerol-3-phosphate acyltransferase [Candidatus Izimaplasma bacterium HR1]|uniref:glycerol-3-phosphate 1-O-acyltransferase PlsY n=1 Tax=Candidatus Izimoplasma sp. HR1 TaxID=1541959 RepID=UPI0004F689D3|nr:Glycerol-3-phosphate acyltransferase [Candidatus Izimaplasma bacterium HR1]